MSRVQTSLTTHKRHLVNKLTNKCNDEHYQIKHFTILNDCMYVCSGFIVPLENFSFIRRVAITGEMLQILTYARRLWALSREGYLPCHTNWDTRHPFIMVISEDLWNSHLCRAYGSEAATTCSKDLGLSRLGPPNLLLAGPRLL